MVYDSMSLVDEIAKFTVQLQRVTGIIDRSEIFVVT